MKPWDHQEVEQMAREAIDLSKRAAQLIRTTPERDSPGVYTIVVSLADTAGGPKHESFELMWMHDSTYEDLREQVRSWLVDLP